MPQDLGAISEALGERYRVLEKLSEGGMATVYLAEDLKHGRKVALKVLVGADLDQETARFAQEIETIARLRHPHILPLHDSGPVPGGLFFVMPFVSDGTLRDRLTRDGPLPVEDALRIAREIAEALSFAHAEGVVHRDIKPENIMMESGQAVVSDFGIALLGGRMAGDSGVTGKRSSPGTPVYMSPEQAAGDEVVDARTDVYSLGCVLYEMLTGAPPFSGSRGHAVLTRKLVASVPSIRIVREEVPESVEALTFKALARLAADRHQTAADLAAELGHLESTVRTVASGAALVQAVGMARAPGRLAVVGILYTAGVALLLTGIGLLSNRAFDLKIQIPPTYGPTRGDYLVVGIQAVIPLLLYAAVALAAAFVVGRYLGPWAGSWMRRRTKGSTDPPPDGRKTWESLAGRRPNRAVADGFVLAMVVASILVFWPFRDLYRFLLLPGAEIYACSSRNLHLLHYMIMPGLIVLLVMVRGALFRWLRVRGNEGRDWVVARWSSLVWLVGLVVVVALPWRVLWDSYYERILIEGEPAYLLVEDDEALLAYTPASGSTRTLFRGEERLDRLGVVGYVFEEREVFDSTLPRCTMTLVPTP